MVMKIQPITTPSRILRTALISLFFAGVILLHGCGERIEHSRSGEIDENQPTFPHPVVNRDWDQIKASGVLRMITYYNSRSYFIHKGGQAGFDFELLERFARENNLTVEVTIAQLGDDLISILNSGQGDVVCTGQAAPVGADQFVLKSRPTGFTHKVVVLPENHSPGVELADLAGLSLTIPWGCPFLPTLQDIRQKSEIPFRINLGPSQVEAEELMTLVSQGRLQSVVVDDLTAKAGMAWIDGLKTGPSLGKEHPTVWLIRQNSGELKSRIDKFLKGHLRLNETGRVRRSQTYGIIFDRYFENEKTIQIFREAAHRPDISGRISGFDELIRLHAEPLNLDWRMVSALIYQESRFYPKARSKADARGLMQVLPAFAGPQADSLYYPTPNLRAGLRLMATTYNSFAYLDSLDRWRFTLATYHAGFGHVTDARRMAIDFGRNPNSWEKGLATTLPKLMQNRHYRDTRHGFYRGAETVDYVEEIINRYRTYCRFVPLDPDIAEPDTVQMDLLEGWDADQNGVPDLIIERPPPE
jgi:peptidoglycan lytic transglycosylase F